MFSSLPIEIAIAISLGALVVLVPLGIYLVRRGGLGEWWSTILGTLTLLLVVAGGIYSARSLWAGYTEWRETSTLRDEIQQAIEETATLANFCDEQSILGGIKMVPYVREGKKGELQITLPPFIIGNVESERLRQQLLASMGVSQAGSPLHGWDVTTELARYYIRKNTLHQVYVEGKVTPPAGGPAPAPGKERWAMMVQVQFPTGKDPVRATSEFLHTVSGQVEGILARNGLALPGNTVPATSATAAPSGTGTLPAFQYGPVGTGGWCPPSSASAPAAPATATPAPAAPATTAPATPAAGGGT